MKKRKKHNDDGEKKVRRVIHKRPAGSTLTVSVGNDELNDGLDEDEKQAVPEGHSLEA